MKKQDPNRKISNYTSNAQPAKKCRPQLLTLGHKAFGIYRKLRVQRCCTNTKSKRFPKRLPMLYTLLEPLDVKNIVGHTLLFNYKIVRQLQNRPRSRLPRGEKVVPRSTLALGEKSSSMTTLSNIRIFLLYFYFSNIRVVKQFSSYFSFTGCHRQYPRPADGASQ